MVAIKDTKMPKSCKKCPMSHSVFGDGWEIWCSLTKKNVVTPNHNCPLVEIVTCKDCKYWDKESTPRVPDTKEYHFCPMMDCNTAEDFFCADAERRE